MQKVPGGFFVYQFHCIPAGKHGLFKIRINSVLNIKKAVPGCYFIRACPGRKNAFRLTISGKIRGSTYICYWFSTDITGKLFVSP
jgi:hypothetical protein